MRCHAYDVGDVHEPRDTAVCTPSEKLAVTGHLAGVLGCVEVAVSLFNFVNIELHSQGWYALQVRVAPSSDIRAVWPCPIIEAEFFGGEAIRRASDQYAVARLEEGSVFRTHVFRIKYCYEEVLLGETFAFQLYLAALKELEKQDVTIEVELLFMESNSNSTLVPETFNLVVVATETIRVNDIARGAFEYYPCTFDSDHFGLCNMSVYTTMLGFTTQEAVDGYAASSQLAATIPQLHADGAARDPQSSGPWERIMRGLTNEKTPERSSRNGRLSHTSISETATFANQSIEKSDSPGAAPPVDDALGQRSLGSAVAKALARGVFVKSGVVAADKLGGPATAEQLQFIRALFDSLGSKRAPKAQFGQPHTLPEGRSQELLRPTELRGLAHVADGRLSPATAGTCDGVPVFPTVDGTSWPDVPDVKAFMERLPKNCSAAEALQLVEAALRRLRQMVWAEWQVLMWVLRISGKDLHRFLKCHWELEQPRLVVPWTVHQSYFWDHCEDHPILYVDESLMRPVKPEGKEMSVWGGADRREKTGSRRGDAVSNWESSSNSTGREGLHVMVFVHGFAGYSTDLSVIKAHICLMYPGVECLSSKANECNTHDSLQDMGQRLAKEVVDFLAPFQRSVHRPLTRLSFIGHSIGNLILRTALTLPEMKPYHCLLHLYVSISGPHLGFLYLGNSMVETGIAVLKHLGRGKCLHQLSFSDANNLRDCFVYKLAHCQPGLSAFKHVVLVSSLKDRYVPFHSSRISSACPAVNKDSKRRDAYKEMVAALIKNVGYTRTATTSSSSTRAASGAPSTPKASANATPASATSQASAPASPEAQQSKPPISAPRTLPSLSSNSTTPTLNSPAAAAAVAVAAAAAPASTSAATQAGSMAESSQPSAPNPSRPSPTMDGTKLTPLPRPKVDVPASGQSTPLSTPTTPPASASQVSPTMEGHGATAPTSPSVLTPVLPSAASPAPATPASIANTSMDSSPPGTSLIRVDVDFELRPKTFSLTKLINNKIGRQAHLEFIENEVYARFLVWGILR
eukprot:gene27133-2362_t